MQGVAFIFLVIFGISMLYAYVAVRRRKLSMSVAGIGSGVVNSICFILFSASREMSFLQALIVGTFFGSLFTAMSMIAASYFNAQDLARASAAAASAGTHPDQ
jgi:hypothetical protein